MVYWPGMTLGRLKLPSLIALVAAEQFVLRLRDRLEPARPSHRRRLSRRAWQSHERFRYRRRAVTVPSMVEPAAIFQRMTAPGTAVGSDFSHCIIRIRSGGEQVVLARRDVNESGFSLRIYLGSHDHSMVAVSQRHRELLGHLPLSSDLNLKFHAADRLAGGWVELLAVLGEVNFGNATSSVCRRYWA